MRRLPLCVALLATSAVVHAGETPLYHPAPDWIAPAPPLNAAALTDASPVLALFDSQVRVKDGIVTSYIDTATRAASAEMLAQMGTIAIPWMPDRGDLTIHRVEILRGGDHIDVLKNGGRFTILRREELMEQRMLTGILTATMSVEGLRVGDILRVGLSITQTDPALHGHEIAISPIIATPARVGFGRTRLIWPAAEKLRWKGYATGLNAVEKTSGGMHEVTIALPVAKQPDMPTDLPQRFGRLPVVEASSFADWNEVSRTLAPLYAADGLIAAGSPLAAEVAAIAAAETDPLRRAQRALQLVQDKIRYLAIGMNGGALTPQPPARTWELRYGDCKAKTLLLLAILRQLGIEAEAVAASAQTGGFVVERLPSASAFDHVLVRATVAGESLWLDGTRLGDRIEDIHDTPPFRYVLPLRSAGSTLLAVPIRPLARPARVVEIAYDQTAAIDLPAVVDVKLTLHGAQAQMIGAAAGQASAEQKREMVGSIILEEIGEAQYSRTAIDYDPAAAVAKISATGVVRTPWRRESGRYRLTLDRAVGRIDFAPDRARAAWRDLPVDTGGIDSVVYRTTIRLPAGATGYMLEGDRTLPATLAGRQVRRQVSLAGDVATLEDRIDSVGAEIAAAAIPAERARYTQARSNILRLLAPTALPSRLAVVNAARKDGRFKPMMAVYDAAIANDPEEVTGYTSRANFRAGVYDRAGAIADLTKAIALAPDVDTHVQRGRLYQALGDRAKAIADYRAARDIDPASDDALMALAYAMDAGGDHDGAIALLDERIARGDKDRFRAIGAKAEILALDGAGDKGASLLDEAIAQRPGDPMLLNSRCWTKAIANAQLDSALKDCTKAIELSESTLSALDSRAVVYLRLGRLDEALADIDAVLDAAPLTPESLFVRAVARKRLGRPGAEDDLLFARAIDPQIEAQYKRFGVTY